jgi:hypothetical protein
MSKGMAFRAMPVLHLGPVLGRLTGNGARRAADMKHIRRPVRVSGLRIELRLGGGHFCRLIGSSCLHSSRALDTIKKESDTPP